MYTNSIHSLPPILHTLYLSTLNLWVQGSNPCGITLKYFHYYLHHQQEEYNPTLPVFYFKYITKSIIAILGFECSIILFTCYLTLIKTINHD